MPSCSVVTYEGVCAYEETIYTDSAKAFPSPVPIHSALLEGLKSYDPYS